MTDEAPSGDPGTPLVELLARAGALESAAPSEHIVTHAAVIVLSGDRAWKMKRPVTYRYLDFAGVDQRRNALTAEYRLNRRTAPDLYRGVHAITRTADGVELDGPGETVDYVLEMARFPADALCARYADDGLLDDALLSALADQVVQLHAQAEVSADTAGAARLLDVIDGNLGSMSRYPKILDPVRAADLTERLRALIARHADRLDARARAGRVRRGHGDLHLQNIVVLDDVPVPFDCLEFDPELATTDVLYDLAFLVMDLWQRGRTCEANQIVNAYLDASPDDEDGYPLLPLMLSVRATVRAHVSAAAGQVDRARGHLDLALAVIDPAGPHTVAIGGASGTGKSTVARAVADRVGAAPGARVLRSDVLRKRLAGVPVLQSLPAAGYTRAASARVYAELERLAAQNLAGGMSVIGDAVYGRAAERAGLRRVADAANATFTGFWLHLSQEERIARIAGRGPDASDADARVARAQTRALDDPGEDWIAVDAAGDPLAEIRERLRERCGPAEQS
ncbi:AAA family ATPase [Gordonia caeni]|uniref:Bifunctional aminoglycoside phosphotransferase/ATP-binding protein n=1 Tax=Gordonia caeni TaxID=1007097 RepID=A0ABP7NVP2_9ACTN